MTTGQAFANGVDGMHASGFGWATPLTVVRRDPQAYGTTRYHVRDEYGRHGYAIPV